MDASAIPILDCPVSAPRPGTLGLLRVGVDDANARLLVTFEFKNAATGADLPLPPTALDAHRYSITGGARRFPHVVKAESVAGSDRQVLLTLDQIGDFSIYTLTFVDPNVDPFFASQKFRFRLDCDDPFDCREPAGPGPLEPEIPVSIDYLAKDYAGFRQALIDFISSRFPIWTERSEADIGMMLLELLAAQADWLSYQQDRVANEAFLGSASTRRSVAGHLALLGYQLDEGAAATTWLQFTVAPLPTGGDRLASLPEGSAVSTKQKRTDPSVLDPRHTSEPVIVFETIADATLHSDHNSFTLYDWGHADCCLDQDATSAALVGEFPFLQIGEWIAFVDDLGHRDVVRLVEEPSILPADPVIGSPTDPLTFITWSADTPLSASYCSSRTEVHGNLVLATHGQTVAAEALRDLTPDELAEVTNEINSRKPWHRIPRQRLSLAQGPLTHIDASTFDLLAGSEADPNEPRPSVSSVQLQVSGQPWVQRASLLDSEPDDEVFRVEIENDRVATVVIGDDCYGAAPDETEDVVATYRVGIGVAGNLGADTLVSFGDDFEQLDIIAVTNPIPAFGGRDPETGDHARRYGPETFKTPLVAVTETDYENAAIALLDRPGHHPIQRAHAEFRWSGSWLTITLAVDPLESDHLDPELEARLLDFLEGRRLAGYDLEAISALYVPIELIVELCILREFRPDSVIHEVKEALSDEINRGGTRGFFHLDNFTFGDPVVVSKLYQTIMAVPGVESAEIVRLSRFRSARPTRDTQSHIKLGMLPVATDEIIRLDNDRNARENGVLTVRLKGGTG
jgi:hypothetical protein